MSRRAERQQSLKRRETTSHSEGRADRIVLEELLGQVLLLVRLKLFVLVIRVVPAHNLPEDHREREYIRALVVGDMALVQNFRSKPLPRLEPLRERHVEVLGQPKVSHLCINLQSCKSR